MPAKKQTTTKEKKGKTPKTEVQSSNVTSSVEEPIVMKSVVEPVVEAVVEAVVESSVDSVPSNEVVGKEEAITKNFMDLMKKLQLLSTTLSTLKQDFKQLEKNYNKEMKAASKEKERKRKSNNKTRQPSGFVKPTKISNELAVFLDKPEGTEMARTEVTREINKYIRQEQLQDASNGRKINPDVKLRKLLDVPESEDLTYFNLQKYLSKHFPKSVTAAPSLEQTN
tara:strand:- start:524 stop:1198 length:675 start_codon:yes stop_codon:yes gene_type:complete